MSGGFREAEVRVRGEVVPVWILGPDGGEARDLVFLHGYARDPRDYRAWLEAVVERGYRVVAPFLFANNGLERPPETFWRCASLALRTVEALRGAGLVQPDAPIFGHSTGAAVTFTMARLDPAPPALVGFNPVQPSSAHPIRFMCRSAWMNTKMTFGLAGDGSAARAVLRESALRFYSNWLRKPGSSYRLIRGLQAYDYDRLERWNRRRPPESRVTAIYGTGDEFYPRADGLEAGLDRSFGDVRVRILDSENSHEWMMFRVERAVRELEDALVT